MKTRKYITHRHLPDDFPLRTMGEILRAQGAFNPRGHFSRLIPETARMDYWHVQYLISRCKSWFNAEYGLLKNTSLGDGPGIHISEIVCPTVEKILKDGYTQMKAQDVFEALYGDGVPSRVSDKEPYIKERLGKVYLTLHDSLGIPDERNQVVEMGCYDYYKVCRLEIILKSGTLKAFRKIPEIPAFFLN